MSERPRVGVAVIVTRGERVLLLRRKNVHGEGTWSTPGGHLEYGESLEACAIREVKEETDLDITHVRFLGITNDVFVASERQYITLWMRSDRVRGKPVARAAHELSEVGWFTWDGLPEPLFLPLGNWIAGSCYRVQSEGTVSHD